MSRTSLDDLLGRSAPRIPHSPVTDELAEALAVASLKGSRHRSLFAKIGVAAGTGVAALSLSMGAAVALPGIPQWWLWVPESDLTIVTEPFELNGDEVTCTYRLAVLTDGKTAGDDSVARLYAARDFLRSVDLDDYRDEAGQIAATSSDTSTPGRMQEASALVTAVGLDLYESGLIGGGVKLDSTGKCEPTP